MITSLVDVRPPTRYDDKEWVSARIEGADEADGEFETVETVDLDPVDCKGRPRVRNFTVDTAADWLRVVFIDEDDVEHATTAVPAGGVTYTPTVEHVAALLHARTKGGDFQAEETGAFDETTNPTATEVEALIVEALADVDQVVGRIPFEFVEDARHVAALRTAVLIERSYVPEQTEGVPSTIYQTLRIQYEEAVKRLAKQVEMWLHAYRGLL